MTFLIIFLKICDLQGKVTSASAGSWFHSLIVLLTKEYLPISVLSFLAIIFIYYLLTHCGPVFFLYIYHKSLIQSKVTFFFQTTLCYHFFFCFMYCVIKCVKSTRVLKGKFASPVFHSCKEKTPKTRKLVSGPQCVKSVIGVKYTP
jgi:hypothetical protein